MRFMVSAAVAPAHMSLLPATVAVASGLMVSISVAMESQPDGVVSFIEYVPGCE